MELFKQINEMMNDFGGGDELERIAAHWREEGQDMGDDELLDAISYDLEMLEYSPEEIDMMAPQVLRMVRGQ